MVKTEIFKEILSAVSHITEIAPERIASNDTTEEAVDARYILVYILHKKGFYASTIAPYIGHRKRSVNRIISDFENRLSSSPMMQIFLKKLELNGFNTEGHRSTI